MIATWHPSRPPLEVQPRNGNFVRMLGQCAPALLSCKDPNGLRHRSVGIRSYRGVSRGIPYEDH